ncbi:uncharacterized protein KY384_008526 [Bacidia gigantensis]|uniref:uncharacterized protein n=1 Tax=Bacidia gigantensis TaxID=2732470 RepID=UPI001D04C29B|nr:uncharacterized protein KY384_008526 [Bacidia gigantensis]KAG8527097.1 hypothetical protein KY384_008526 [Bacidia gigantensis]
MFRYLDNICKLLAFACLLALAIRDTNAQECAAGSAKKVAGNWYCSAVNAIKYENFPGHGFYNKVSNMNATTGECTSEQHNYSGSLSPLDEELSLHIRGPTWLKQVAIYTLEDKVGSNEKRETDAHRHDKPGVHEYLHNYHAKAKERAVGDEVVVTMDGKIVSWVNEYAGPRPATQLPSASHPAHKHIKAQSTAVSRTISSHKTTPTEDSSVTKASPGDTDRGNGWTRRAFYNADSGKAQGLTFLNHFGGTKGIPGTAAGGSAFGASLSYASADGQSGAGSPQTLQNAMIEDDAEIVIMSDESCDDGGCGYVRAGGVAYHGFGGSHKIFLLEFSMPVTGKTGFNGDMPGIWLLNAQIPHTSQYGINPDCSCWTSGCGEFDLFEILDSHDMRCRSTLHMAPAGGSSDYFDRPTKDNVIAAVIFSGNDNGVVIRVLKEGETDFGGSLDPKTMAGWMMGKTTSSANQPPALPQRPSSLNSVVNRTASNYSPYSTANRFGTGAYGASPYNSYSSYSSPYNRFGSGYGGMGSMYGGGMYGGGGMGGMYGGGMYGQSGMMGPGMDPNDPNSLTNSFSQSTQATFSMIENLVGALSGVSQMLESTYMATHSSFFAMVSVAEQFANLRTTLGSILGIFTLMRYFRTLFAKITGRPPPADATSLTPSSFAKFQGLSSSPTTTTLPNGQAAPSRKPFLLFLAAVVGLPYLMTKLIRSLDAQNQQQQQQQQQQPEGSVILGSDGRPLPDQYQGQPRQLPIDPSNLEFCRVLYDYPPPNQPQLDKGMDLSVKANDLVAILSKDDPMGQPSEWWQCRTRDHQVGYLPSVYLKPFIKKPVEQIEGHSRVNTLSSVLGGGKEDENLESRANSLKVEAKEKERAGSYN